jgi:hypothetical protein
MAFYCVLYCVSCSECYFYLCFFKNYVIFFVSLPLYVKAAYTSDVEETLKFKTFKGFKKKVAYETASN